MPARLAEPSPPHPSPAASNSAIGRARRWNGRPAPSGTVLVYAHRGARGLLPEHTLPAYAEALRIGCDYVDIDVQLSRDGILVATHDLTLNPDLTRDSLGTWITTPLPVHSLSFVELRRRDPSVATAFLSAPPRPGPDTAAWTAGCRPEDHGFSFPRMVHALGGSCWEPCEAHLSRAALDEAHALGLKVVTWGWPELEGSEFDESTLHRLVDQGVDGLITDRPDRLLDLLRSRGLDVPSSLPLSSSSNAP